MLFSMYLSLLTVFVIIEVIAVQKSNTPSDVVQTVKITTTTISILTTWMKTGFTLFLFDMTLLKTVHASY